MAFLAPVITATGSQQQQQQRQQQQQSPTGRLCALSISPRALDSVNGLACASTLDYNP